MHKKKLTIFLSCCFVIFILNQCISTNKKEADVRGNGYAGSVTCQACHREVYNSYLQTAHNRTSAPASKQSILGSFAKHSNAVEYRPTLIVNMEEKDSGFYQVAYLDDVAKQQARFDIVMGSGSKGQSYLSWLDNTIFQLPVSYFVPAKEWINSPGYPPKYVLFNRNIPIGCFGCHSSFIKRTGSVPENGYLIDHFDKAQIIYGIDCERCHGPLAAHVKYHEENPSVKSSHFVTKITSLERGQKTDLCAICHSGAGDMNPSSFYYQPGSKLSDYLHTDNSILNIKDVDVHGKQYQLLSASKCYLKSGTLTCVSCHNAHKDEKNDLAIYSVRCQSCHTNVVHTSPEFNHLSQEAITTNCIDCHMPAMPSRAITMKSSSQTDSISALVRTHLIAVYKQTAAGVYLKR